MNQKSVATSLLSLNEYCLLEICEFLKLQDLVNLDKTCQQLKFIAARVCAQKYKKMEVEIHKNKGMNKKDFSNTLTAIGEHILSLLVDGANQSILQLITDNCKNIHRIELWDCKGPIELQCFENLKELKLNAVQINTNELKSCFAKNAELETLEYGCSNDEDFLELLDMLPKLQNLHLHNVPHSLHLNPHLHCLDGLTKFSFYSLENCNQLLIALTKNPKLKELQVWMPLDIDSFDIIKLFPSLEIFGMHHFGRNESLPESIVLPPTLKSVKVTGVKISCKALLSAVKERESLNEFDLGYQHNLDKSLDFNDKMVITQIERGLKAELALRQRPLNIIYYDCESANKQLYVHCSTKLHIINSYAADHPSQSHLITVSSPV